MRLIELTNDEITDTLNTTRRKCCKIHKCLSQLRKIDYESLNSDKSDTSHQDITISMMTEEQKPVILKLGQLPAKNEIRNQAIL